MTDLAIGEVLPISDYFHTIRRRKWQVLLVALLILLLAAAAALFWPPTYRSSATILIEEPDVPNDLVRSTVSGFADERLQIIQQRVMTTQNLQNIIDKFNLYPDERATNPITQIVEEMRTKIDLELVSADTSDSRTGRAAKPTIAFTISFDGQDPQTTQQVANELVTLYLSENQRTREEQASGTAGFLTSESDRLSQEIQKQETELAQFKAQNAGSLPEELSINTQLLDRTQSQILDLSRQLQSLVDRQAYLQSQLATVDPYAPMRSGNDALLDPKDQLRSLKAQYAAMSAKFGKNHPDVLALKRQIDELGGAAGADTDRKALEAQLKELQTRLQVARQKYGANHPDVKSLEDQIAAAKTSFAKLPVASSAGSSSSAPDNPVFIQLQSQLGSVSADIAAGRQQLQALTQKAKEIEERVFRTPEVERGYSALKRSYDATVAKYEEVKSKEREAELARNLETERMGEKLSLIEPPDLPVDPIKPNRKLIAVLGVFLAIVGGTGGGVLADSLSGRVYGARRLTHTLGAGPLVVVPVIRTRRDRRRAWALTGLAVLLVGLAGGGFAYYLDTYVAPLDVIWGAVLNHMGLS